MCIYFKKEFRAWIDNMFHSCNVALEKNENLVSIKRNNYCIIMNVKTGKL
jgi:hypothetical protein